MLPPLYHHRMFITFALWMFSFYTVCTLQLIVLGSRTINFTINSVFLVDHIVWFLFDVLNVVCVHMLVNILTWKMYCAHVLSMYSMYMLQVFHLLFFSQPDPLRPQVLLAFRSLCFWKAGISLCLDCSFSVLSNFRYYVSMNCVGWFCNVQGSSV